jgi:Holliday junction resolvase RusA-like endonuclease
MTWFTIPGQPQGKGRDRFARMGAFTRAYTPEKTVTYENLIKTIYVYEKKGKKYEGAVSMRINAYYAIPKGTSKVKTKAMLTGDIRPTKKPDFDNIAKVISDALNKIAYNDDTQIVEATFIKWYAEIPRVEVLIEEVAG